MLVDVIAPVAGYEGIIPELDPAVCEYDVASDEADEFPEYDGGKVVCGYDESFCDA
ncbi:MAG: hypothetical protein II877_05145 [Synergistaceae bacterium]|nr:hypothetical protein [Synergistaceae bacterium]MBQ6973138.1 hypothetical protein [Synergistaceae bacterium]